MAMIARLLHIFWVLFILLTAVAASAADQRIIVGFQEAPPLIFSDANGQIRGIAVIFSPTSPGKRGGRSNTSPAPILHAASAWKPVKSIFYLA